ncbi:alpha/beta fold hydrolase [Lentzea sp. NPDC058450]|uniref:alpha/beta fold hydrolase n=1 Tax=Lentzea sp. NPDC058450 TaxID=3346505 RepID=UPI003650BBF9
MKLAATDFGGEGTPHLLLHGLGGARSNWEALAPHLNGRAVAVDLRGHGESPDGEWDWEAVLDDLDETVVHFGLGEPVVVGHSLGGVLAGLWALRHPACPAAISLDGHRSATTHPENYPGLAAEEVTRSLAALNALFDAQLETITRPPRRILDVLRTSPELLDALPVFARVTAPFLLVFAARDLPVPPELLPLSEAHRAGVRRDLPPNIEVHEIDATHGLVGERPAEVAAIVNQFVSNRVKA